MQECPVKLIRQKVIISGDMVEYYQYQEPIVCSGPKKHGKSSNYRKEQWAVKNKKNAFHRLLRLVAANFGDANGRFITLTYAENFQDVEAANRHFNTFIKRLRKEYGSEFRYVVTIEFQKRGAVHYHMLTDMPYIKDTELRRIWGHGFVKVKEVKNSKHAAVYVGKYMGKGTVDKRLTGKKNFWASRNMTYPKVLTNEEAAAYMASLENTDKEKYTEKAYPSDYYGEIQYVKYFLQPGTAPESAQPTVHGTLGVGSSN